MTTAKMKGYAVTAAIFAGLMLAYNKVPQVQKALGGDDSWF